MIKYIFLLIFSISIIQLNAQLPSVKSIQSGDWSACITWSNQLLIGAEPPLISSKNKVTVSKTSNTWQGLTLEDGTSELIIEPNTTLNVRTTGLTQSLNMDNCPTLFKTDFSSDKCIPLWGNSFIYYPVSATNSTLANYATNALVLDTVLVPGHYIMEAGSYFVVTLPSSIEYGESCPPDDFLLQAALFVLNNKGDTVYIDNPITFVNYSSANVFPRYNMSFPNCVGGFTSDIFADYASRKLTKDFDFGNCLSGYVICLKFISTKKASKCQYYYGLMRGLSAYVIKKID